MWMFNRDGFFSVVEHRGDNTKLIVRARSKHDLIHLRAFFAGAEIAIMHTPNADYEWRVILDRGDWAMYCEDSAQDIDYDNFKNSIARRDPERAHLYMSVWDVMLEAQR